MVNSGFHSPFEGGKVDVVNFLWENNFLSFKTAKANFYTPKF